LKAERERERERERKIRKIIKNSQPKNSNKNNVWRKSIFEDNKKFKMNM